MRIGCPKEIKAQECRVGLTPAGVDALVRAGHEVYMEDCEAAKPYLMEAKKLGVEKAEEVLTEISKNRNIYRMSDNN